MDCSIEGCARPMKYKTLGLCFAHYQKHLRHGTATPDPANYKRRGRAPDPTKWRSRYNPDNPSRSRPKKEKTEQTHCKHGHALTEENRYWHTTAQKWVCRTCAKEATRRYREKEEQRDYGKCKNGHPITPENTIVQGNGSTRCRPCTQAHMKKRRLKKYGLTVEQFDELLSRQNRGCAICGAVLGDNRDTHVDHFHDDGRVRGILCGRCNTGLGMFSDSPERLLAAAQYLMDADAFRLSADSSDPRGKTG